MNLKERFWSKVNIKGPNDCWEWQAGKDNHGYGNFRISKPRRIVAKSNRVSYALKHNLDPCNFEGSVLHSCDNPSCCNPNHLRIGTHQDNMNDKVLRKRCFNGNQKNENNSYAKLNEPDVKEIKELIKQGLTNKEITIIFNVTNSNISSIRRGKSWNKT